MAADEFLDELDDDAEDGIDELLALIESLQEHNEDKTT